MLTKSPAQASLERMQAPLKSPQTSTAAKRLSAANSFNEHGYHGAKPQ